MALQHPYIRSVVSAGDGAPGVTVGSAAGVDDGKGFDTDAHLVVR